MATQQAAVCVFPVTGPPAKRYTGTSVRFSLGVSNDSEITRLFIICVKKGEWYSSAQVSDGVTRQAREGV